MPRLIEVEESKTAPETGDRLAMQASAVLHELYPAGEWRQAMTAMVQRLNQLVRETGENIQPRR